MMPAERPEKKLGRGRERAGLLARDQAVGHFLWLQAGRAATRGGNGGTALSSQAQDQRRPAAE